MTRLQLILVFALLIGLGYGGVTWYQNRLDQAPAPSRPPALISKPIAPVPVASTLVSPAPVISKTVTPKSVAPIPTDTYEVSRGDTLWGIAQTHSPVHDGAGWVAIWKANKALVKNFNRLEIGWTLVIPSTPAQYVMPYWKPKSLAVASAASASSTVDLSQLPGAEESQLVDLRELPTAPADGTVDLAELPILGEEAGEFAISAFKRPALSYLGQTEYHP